MRNLLNEYISVKEAMELTDIKMSTFYTYLYKDAIEGAIRFSGTRWMIPKKWVNSYLSGEVNLKGIYKGDYAKRKNRE